MKRQQNEESNGEAVEKDSRTVGAKGTWSNSKDCKEKGEPESKGRMATLECSKERKPLCEKLLQVCVLEEPRFEENFMKVNQFC